MKFLKHCTVWMLLVCVLFCFAACKEQQEQRDERELSVFELTYSQELRDKIIDTYDQWRIDQYGDDGTRSFVVSVLINGESTNTETTVLEASVGNLTQMYPVRFQTITVTTVHLMTASCGS